MNRTVFGVLALTGLAACDEPTQPASPSVTPPAAVVAAKAQFTVRDLGTLGGPESHGAGINEQVEVVGSSDLPSGFGDSRAFLWRAGQGMRSLGTLGGDRGSVAAVESSLNLRPSLVRAATLMSIGTSSSGLWVEPLSGVRHQYASRPHEMEWIYSQRVRNGFRAPGAAYCGNESGEHEKGLSW